MDALKQVQRGDDFTIIKSSDLSRIHIKRLVDNNFLKPIIKGWYVVTDPRTMPSDSTAWYASFWNFITRYANERYGNEWCLSAETMKRMGYTIYEEDPFEKVMEIHVSQSPYTPPRLRLMWQNMREDVIANFARLKSNLSAKDFLERMETQYKLDAYHSLSIEGYRVTDVLINKVKSGSRYS